MTENLAGRGEGLAGLGERKRLVRRLILAIAKEAVELAIVRSELTWDEAADITEEQIAKDAALAIFGAGTCDDQPTENVQKLLAALEAAAPPGTAPPASLIEASKNLLEACYQADALEELPQEIDGSLLDAVRDGLLAAAALATPSPQTPHGPSCEFIKDGKGTCGPDCVPAATQEQPAGSAPSIASTSVTTPRKITWFCRICERDHTAYCPAVSEESFLQLCDHCGQSFQGNQHECPSPSAPLLEQFFRNRFNAEWTPELERELLEIIAARNSAADPGSPRKVGEEGAEPAVGSGALRELRAKVKEWRDRERYAGSPDEACVYPHLADELEEILNRLSLSSPIEPSCVRMEQPLGRLREIASGAVSASVAKQIRECVNQIVDLRLYGEAQASSEIREALELMVKELTLYANTYGLGPARLQYALSRGERALAPSRQGAGGK